LIMDTTGGTADIAFTAETARNLFNIDFHRCHQMSDIKAKMHQIRFRLGLRPRPHYGSLQRSPQTPG